MTADAQILIVGAGCTGLAAALELSRQGVRCRIVDQMPAANTESRGTGIQVRTLELLQLYGIGRALHDAGNLCRALQLYIGGEPVGEADFSASDSPFGGSPALPQARTEAILRDRLAAFDVTVEFATRVVSVAQDDESCTAIIERPDGATETAGYAWIIAADGARSPLREAAGLGFDGVSYPEGWGLMDARLDWDRTPDAVRIFQDGRFQDEGAQQVVTVPLGGDLYRLQIDHRPDALRAEPPTVAEMQTAIDRLVPFPAQVSQPGWRAAFRIHRRQIVTYRDRRLLFAGDAAHIHTPAGGQGLNTGIQDGINLAWKLALVVQGRADPRLIDSYEAERKPVAAGVLHITELLARNPRAMFGEPGISPRTLANRLGQLAVGYRDGPLGQGTGGDGLVAGDRVPDVAIAGCSVYDRLQDGGIVVARFGEARLDGLTDRVRVWDVDADDAEGVFARAVGIETGAAIVRPDAYFGLVERSAAPAAAIGRWLSDRLGLVA